jgi:hypothetical protein
MIQLAISADGGSISLYNKFTVYQDGSDQTLFETNPPSSHILISRSLDDPRPVRMYKCSEGWQENRQEIYDSVVLNKILDKVKEHIDQEMKILQVAQELTYKTYANY